MAASATAVRSRHTERAQRTGRLILDAAAQCFGADGYSQVSMDTIAAQAGVTKPTVYAHFGSKEALFEVLIHEMLAELIETPLPAVDSIEGVEQALLDHAAARIDMQLDGSALGLYRAASAEAMRRPEWAQSIIASLDTSELELWFAAARDQGLLAIDSAEAAAETFWALVKGSLFYPVVIGIAPVPTPSQRQQVIRRSVDTLLAAFTAQDPPTAEPD